MKENTVRKEDSIVSMGRAEMSQVQLGQAKDG